MAVAFYAALAAAGWFWRVQVDGVGPWSAEGGARFGLLVSAALGLAVGLVLVWGSRVWTRRSAAGRTLHEALAEVVGGLAPWSCAVLALASGAGEEILFRGALQPRVGLLMASLLFGAAHFVPRPGLRVWSVFAAFAGAVFGLLFETTGSLVAPIVAHATVNGLNLHWIARGAPPTRSPVGDAGFGDAR